MRAIHLLIVNQLVYIYFKPTFTKSIIIYIWFIVTRPSDPIDPCHPSPCGPNAKCRPVGDSPSCSCLREFIGSPPNCKPECISNAECSNQLACINQKCKDPCPGLCGSNAGCRVISHTAMCICNVGYFGDPFTQCQLKPHIAEDNINPCNPNPCGSNAICREQNNVGSCQCISEYFGNPYETCRPECVLNSDCASNKACIQNKCQNPCPGRCGQNAECSVVFHLPTCLCRIGYKGDPYTFCGVDQNERKTSYTNHYHFILTPNPTYPI